MAVEREREGGGGCRKGSVEKGVEREGRVEGDGKPAEETENK